MSEGRCTPSLRLLLTETERDDLRATVERVEALLEPHRLHDATSGRSSEVRKVHIRARDLRDALDGPQ